MCARIGLVVGAGGLERGGGVRVENMTYREAVLHVLRSARHPLTTREITDQALEKGLINPRGKTPHQTMQARLYTWVRTDPELVKLESPGRGGRAKRGSVRWALRKPTAVDPSSKD